MANNNKNVRYELLKAAYQVSFDGSYSLDGSFRFILNNGDDGVRALLELILAIELLKKILKEKKGNSFSLFHEFLSQDEIITSWNNCRQMRDVPLVRTSDVGELLIAIINESIGLYKLFPSYTMHPYFDFFSSIECERFYSWYHNSYVCTSFYLNTLSIVGLESLSVFLSEAEKFKPSIDCAFNRILSGFQSEALRESALNFEKKAIFNFIEFNDFFDEITKDSDNAYVVIKVIFYLPRDVGLGEVNNSADSFSEMIEKFSASLRKSSRFKGFVKITSVIRAPQSSPWYIESYITLTFPKGGYAFNYNPGSLRLWCESDDSFLNAIRVLCGMKRSKNYSEISKELNSYTSYGKNMTPLIKKLGELNHLSPELNKKNNIGNTFLVECDFFKKQIVFDALSFLHDAQVRWNKLAKPVSDIEHMLPGYQDIRLKSMVLLYDGVEDVIYAPNVLICDKDIPRGSKLNERFYKYIDDLIVNVGIQKSQNALNELRKTAMSSMFYMSLDLRGKTKSFDEVRNTYSGKNINELLPVKLKRKSYSLSQVSKIIKRLTN